MTAAIFCTTNGVSQAQTVIDALEDALTQHGGYTKQATVVSASSSQPCSVWRSSGDYNALRRDWYLLVLRTQVNPGNFYLGVAEQLDIDQTRVIAPVPGTAAGSAVPGEDFSYGGGQAFPIWNVNAPNLADIKWLTVTAGSGVNAWALASNDTVTLMLSKAGTTTGEVFQAGVGEPFRDDDPGIVYLNSSATAGGVTRHPTVTAANAKNWEIASFNDPLSVWTPTSGLVNGGGDRLHNNRPVAARKLIAHTGSPAVTGRLRGLYRNTIGLAVATADGQAIPPLGEQLFTQDDIYMWPGQQIGNLWINTSVP